MKMTQITRKCIALIFMVVACQVHSQTNPVLYQSDYQKVSFKKIDNHYGYILEEYSGMFGGTLISYKIDGKDFIIEPLDTIIIMDSMVFQSDDHWNEDSIQLALEYRIDEFTGNQMWDRRLKYIINDSLIFMVNPDDDDEFHRVIIPIQKTPYSLKIITVGQEIGPFTITSKNDVSCKLVVMSSAYTGEFDHYKDLPKRIVFEGNEYRLKHTFERW